MTEREKELIEAYIPSPRDTTLGDFQYYAQDLSGRIQKVEITDICPRANGETVYRVVQADTRKRVKGWRDYDGFAMSDLYDNIQIDESVIFLDYGENTERFLAPTRGGGEFAATVTVRDIEFDGRHGKTAGTQVIEEQGASIKVTTLCMSQE